MLEFIARIRPEMLFSETCRNDFVPSAEMLQRFSTHFVYNPNDHSSCSIDIDELQPFLRSLTDYRDRDVKPSHALQSNLFNDLLCLVVM